jgi:uncharacterized protein (DUF4213/DUF364 family)
MASALLEDVLATLTDGTVLDVSVGCLWTAVTVEVAGRRRCGLAGTLRAEEVHGQPMVRNAGHLAEQDARELAHMVQLGPSSLTEASIGMAALNALLPIDEDSGAEVHAADVIARHGAGKRVALVGHFPFVDALRQQVHTLWVLELAPYGDDLPADAAPDIVPQADVLAITGTTLINGTFDGLMALRRPEALVLVLGPSTPLSPVLFDHGVDLVSGALVQHIDPVLAAVRQGANFHQARQAGVHLMTLYRERRV